MRTAVRQVVLCLSSPAVVAIAVAMVAYPPPGYAQSPSEIVFHSERDGNAEIYVMNPDGTKQTRLTNNLDREITPALSPNRQLIAFTVERRWSTMPWQHEIFTMNRDGSNRRSLRSGREPAFSPDGTKIVFADGRCDRIQCYLDIYTMDADGSNVKRLTDDTADDRVPSFSPDGKTIVFESDRDYPTTLAFNDIYTMNLDGSNMVRLTRTGRAGAPKFTPDGRGIVFVATSLDTTAQVAIMDANGANTRRLTREPVVAWSVAVSPDGRKIAFQNCPWVGGVVKTTRNCDIYVIGIDGANVMRLTTGSEHDGSPDWQ